MIDSHRVDGSQGTIVTSGMLSLTAATVDHRGATIGADRIALDVQQLDNSGGRIVASGTGASSLQADTLDNAGGIVASAGDLTVVSTLLDNTQGTLQHSGNGQLHLTAQTLLGDAGKLLSNGALTLHGQTTDLRNATTSQPRSASTLAISPPLAAPWWRPAASCSRSPRAARWTTAAAASAAMA